MEDTYSQLTRLLDRKQRPTAFLVSRPNHALTALGHLVRRAVNFSKETACIARDHHTFLEHVVSTAGRYQVDPVLFAHKISDVVLEMASGGDARATIESFPN